MCKKSVKLKTQSSRNTCNNRLYIYRYYEPDFDCYLVRISVTSIKLHHIFGKPRHCWGIAWPHGGGDSVLHSWHGAPTKCWKSSTPRNLEKKIVTDGGPWSFGWMKCGSWMWVKRHVIRISKEFRVSRHHPGTKLLTLFHCKRSYFLAKGWE